MSMDSYVLVAATLPALVALSVVAFFCSSRGRRHLASPSPSHRSDAAGDVELGQAAAGLDEAVLRQAGYPTTVHWPEHRQADVDAQCAVCEAVQTSYPTTVYVYSSSDDRQGDVDATQCAVCLEEYAGGEELRRLPDCGHAFHRGCVDQWLRLHPTCPVCRGRRRGAPAP